MQAVKDLQRLRDITKVVVRHGFGELLDRTRIWEVLGRRTEGARLTPEELRATSARRFRELLAELGPTFIKLGQILSSRPDILPPDFIAELSKLQDDAPPIPVEEVFAQIQKAFGKPASELFASIDPAPLASASIAQVHRARLRPQPGSPEAGEAGLGVRVVVKVQRPGIEEQIKSDTDLLAYLARFLEGVIEETGIYTPTGIVSEFRQAMLTELDFEVEAGNIEAFAENHRDRPAIAVPRLYRELSCKTVITLEELLGTKMSEVLQDPQRWDHKKLAKLIIDEAFNQIFADGLFHGDPHPGNIIVLEGPRLGLIDFGLVGRLSKQMQEAIILLVLSISLRDPDTVARLLYKVGIPDQRINLHQFRTDIHDILERYLGLKISEVDSGTLLSELVDLAMKYKIKVPKEYAVLSKAAGTVEGLIRTLDPEMDVVEVALPYARKLLYERYNPGSMGSSGLRLLLQLQGFLQDTPAQLAQILMDLEGGKFVVTVKNEELERINGSLKALGVLFFGGSIASALIIGAFSLAGRYPPTETGGTTWPIAAVMGLTIAALVIGAAFGWILVGGRFKKLSVRRMFRER